MQKASTKMGLRQWMKIKGKRVHYGKWTSTFKANNYLGSILLRPTPAMTKYWRLNFKYSPDVGELGKTLDTFKGGFSMLRADQILTKVKNVWTSFTHGPLCTTAK